MKNERAAEDLKRGKAYSLYMLKEVRADRVPRKPLGKNG